jgi:hypothetical protein
VDDGVDYLLITEIEPQEDVSTQPCCLYRVGIVESKSDDDGPKRMVRYGQQKLLLALSADNTDR